MWGPSKETIHGKFVPIHGLHHWAYRCRDAEETRRFYEDLLGLPLTHFIRQDEYVGTSGERVEKFAHIFFEMADGARSRSSTSATTSPPSPRPTRRAGATTWRSKWSRSRISRRRTSACRPPASRWSGRSTTTAG